MEYFMATDKNTGEVKEIWTNKKLQAFQRTHTTMEFLQYLQERDIYPIEREVYIEWVQEKKLDNLRLALRHLNRTDERSIRIAVQDAMLKAAKQALHELDIDSVPFDYDPGWEYMID